MSKVVANTPSGKDQAPKLRDFSFLIWLDPKSQSRAAVGLLAEYAANATRFFHDRQDRYTVESLANARMFAEYAVTYVERREGIPPLITRQPVEDGFDARRGKFARRLDNIREHKPQLELPVRALKRIWDDAGDAVHPPEGLGEVDILNHKHNYLVQAGGVLKDALHVALWLKAQYKTMGLIGRLRSWWRSKPKANDRK